MTRNNRDREWRRVFFKVRTSVLVWYVLLMAASAVVSTLTIRQILFARLDTRVEKSLVQEVYHPGANIVDVYVGYLRKKLGNDAIETVPGIGYRLRT